MKLESPATLPTLDFQSSKPLLDQVTDYYREALLSGAIQEGERLPTCLQIGQALGMAPQTINRAFEALAREGLVYRRRSLGTIAGPPPSKGQSSTEAPNPPTKPDAPSLARPKRRAPLVCVVMNRLDGLGNELTSLITDYLNGLIEGFSLCSFRFEIISPQSGQSVASMVANLIDEGNIDGLVHLHLDDETTQILLDRHFPFVGLNINLTAFDIPSVVANHVEGYSEAWSYADKLGHKKAAFLGLSEQNEIRRYECAAGRELAHVAASLDYLMLPDGLDTQEAIEALIKARLGSRHTKQWPTLIFTQTDLLAMRLIEVLHKMGIKVPSQVSVIGFNDTSVAGNSTPAVTTLAKPRRKMALAAAHLLSDFLEKRPGNLGRLQVFPLKLVVRETSQAV